MRISNQKAWQDWLTIAKGAVTIKGVTKIAICTPLTRTFKNWISSIIQCIFLSSWHFTECSTVGTEFEAAMMDADEVKKVIFMAVFGGLFSTEILANPGRNLDPSAKIIIFCNKKKWRIKSLFTSWWQAIPRHPDRPQKGIVKRLFISKSFFL